MQHCFDNLYAQSVNGQNFYDLMKLISSNENIRLAILYSLTMYLS